MTENSSAEAEAQSIHTRLMALFNESWKYFLVSAASLALDLMVYWTLIRILGVHYLIANIIPVGKGLSRYRGGGVRSCRHDLVVLGGSGRLVGLMVGLMMVGLMDGLVL